MDGIAIGFTSIGITLIIQLCAGIWWAATITEKLRQLGEALIEIKNDTKKRLDQFIEENEKSHKLLWSKQDDLRNRVTVIETRCYGYHNGVKHELSVKE
jgi:hypothetical protein